MQFLLGTHRPNWLERLDVPLFVSHRTLNGRKRLPVARCEWALDSGGFSELTMFGEWRTTTTEYVEAVARYQAEVGQLLWAAPMDWMCEPHIINKTGLSVREHQERTVTNYLDIRHQGPFIPVLQGWTISDYETCVSLYADAGVDLTTEPVVGVGSVCRRQGTWDIAQVMATLSNMGIRLHGFGIKRQGLALCSDYLTSADSMAWSYAARRDWPLPGCSHRSCANCSRYALRWRDETLMPLRQMKLREAA